MQAYCRPNPLPVPPLLWPLEERVGEVGEPNRDSSQAEAPAVAVSTDESETDDLEQMTSARLEEMLGAAPCSGVSGVLGWNLGVM